MTTIINAATSGGLIQTADTSGILQLQTASTAAVTIDASQNVGIGTASPAAKVEISGTAAAQNLALRITNTATDGYSTLQLGGGGDGGVFRNGSAQSGYAGASSLNLITVGAHAIGLATGNTIRAIIPAAGGVQAVTCVSVGNATPSASGAGITFPATQSASSDANCLDDYEEGTFTSSVTCSVSGTLTTIYNTGAYTKVGRLVTVTAYIQFSSVSSPNGYMRITLPFSTASGVQFESTSCFAFNNIVSGNIVDFCGVVNSASSSFDIYAGTGTALSASSANLMQANTSFRFSATYMTA
jgi:hypothetical protein